MHKVEQIEHRGGKRALRCSRPKGHESFHIACCLAPNFEEHMMAVWDDNGNDIKGLLEGATSMNDCTKAYRLLTKDS